MNRTCAAALLVSLAGLSPAMAQGVTNGTVRTLGTSRTPGVTTANPVTGGLSNNTGGLSTNAPSAAASGYAIKPGVGLKPNSGSGQGNGSKPAPMQPNGVRKIN